MIGHDVTDSASDNQETTQGISNALSSGKLDLIRLKTGTPARIKRSSVHFDRTEVQPGDEE